ncbi:hypothetical protein GX411_10140 [Candidatus Fermentibacteria bacterium]|nr:hypothetical protein [Candidatus Fermentibacteria bacterium]
MTGLFRKRRLKCPAGAWTTVYSSSFTGYPASWLLEITAPGGTLPAGRLVQKRSFWIFPGSVEEVPIQPEMRIVRHWINTFYSVKLRPEADVDVTIRREGL